MLQKFPPHAAKTMAKTAAVMAILLTSTPVMAQTSAAAQNEPAFAAMDIPVTNANPEAQAINNDEITHPPLRLTPDKSSIVTLERSAGSIIVGNPAHLNIMADSANRLIVVPRAPGASFFTVLDKDGKLLMQRHVIVASPKEKYLRVRNTCTSGSNCQPTNVYYCPDMCHQILLGTDDSSQSKGSANAQPGDEQLQITATGKQAGGDEPEVEPRPEETDVNE